ncbi:MAG: glutamate formimidoyltransferase [Candidatus Hydrothermae bacterium]|nr:glutamate formimidoyltransferase [Candidatus Hydrothermae bacterium]
MKKIVECVPNFSEGRNMNVINAIAKEIEETEGVKLLDVDPGAATNRTVITFAGTPEGVKKAAFKAIKKAAELIDMRKHKGEHPRIGAADVVPFVPVSGVTMEECVQIAHEVAKRVAEELKIPVYLYEEAATKPERRDLANIRKGEYEGLSEKLKDPEWRPDYGEPVFNPQSGATVIGAREFLIAYNVNLNTRDKKLAHKIAKVIREKGYKAKDDQGNKIQVPGKLKKVKAIGWYIEEYGIAQVSINLTNYKITPLWKVFEACEEEAQKLGLRVTGSEIVGLIPKKALLDVGRHYLKKQGKNPGVPEEELIHIAIKSLGLDDISPFDPREKIIEYKLEEPGDRRLEKMVLRDFVNELSTDSPAPGGGSVSALSGALSAALSSMVANLTHGKKGYEEHNELMEEIALKAQELKDKYLQFIDEDTRAFNLVMEAFRLPKKTEEDKKIREKKIEEATKEATRVPLKVLETTLELLNLAEVVADKGNVNSVSDAGVAALQAKACAEGAYLNVIINFQGLSDQQFVEEAKNRAETLLQEIQQKATTIYEKVKEKIGE